MAKLEELLKAQGFTDAEIAANATLLADPRTRTALESSYSALEADLTKFKDENKRWADWHETDGKPLLALYEKERADALADAASLKERLRLAEEAGFAPTSSHKEPEKKVETPAAFDPKAHKLVTQDDIAKYADAEGQAMAMLANLQEEYRLLTGKSLFEYSTEIDGRTLRGVEAIRAENMRTNGGKVRLDQYASQKFDFAGKRQVIADKQKADAEAALRADERSKVMKEMGDPNLRPLMPSHNPFVPRPASADAKQPWEGDMTASQRRANRLNRAVESQMKAGA